MLVDPPVVNPLNHPHFLVQQQPPFGQQWLRALAATEPASADPLSFANMIAAFVPRHPGLFAPMPAGLSAFDYQAALARWDAHSVAHHRAEFLSDRSHPRASSTTPAPTFSAASMAPADGDAMDVAPAVPPRTVYLPERRPEDAGGHPPDPPDPPLAPPARPLSLTMRDRGLVACRDHLHATAPSQFAKTPLPATTQLNPQDVPTKKAQARCMQASIMEVVHEADYERLRDLVKDSPRDLVRLTALCAKGANAILNADLRDPAQQLSSVAARVNFRARKGMAPDARIAANPQARCCCGFLLADDDCHFKTCAQFRLEQNKTHNGVRDLTLEMVENSGAVGSIEVTLPGTQAKDGKTGSGRRVDVTARFPGLVNDDMTDVSITCPTSACYLASPASLTDPLFGLHARAHVKRQKYESIVEGLHGHFVPLIFSSFGNGTPAVHAFLHKIANSAAYSRKLGDFSVKTMRTRLATLIVEHASHCVVAGIGRMKVNWVLPQGDATA